MKCILVIPFFKHGKERKHMLHGFILRSYLMSHRLPKCSLMACKSSTVLCTHVSPLCPVCTLLATPCRFLILKHTKQSLLQSLCPGGSLFLECFAHYLHLCCLRSNHVLSLESSFQLTRSLFSSRPSLLVYFYRDYICHHSICSLI